MPPERKIAVLGQYPTDAGCPLRWVSAMPFAARSFASRAWRSGVRLPTKGPSGRSPAGSAGAPISEVVHASSRWGGRESGRDRWSRVRSAKCTRPAGGALGQALRDRVSNGFLILRRGGSAGRSSPMYSETSDLGLRPSPSAKVWGPSLRRHPLAPNLRHPPLPRPSPERPPGPRPHG